MEFDRYQNYVCNVTDIVTLQFIIRELDGLVDIYPQTYERIMIDGNNKGYSYIGYSGSTKCICGSNDFINPVSVKEFLSLFKSKCYELW